MREYYTIEGCGREGGKGAHPRESRRRLNWQGSVVGQPSGVRVCGVAWEEAWCRGACHWSRRTSPQPFAPRGKGRFARDRGARQSADWLRPRPLRAPALSASVRRQGGELRRTWHGRVRAFRGRPRLPPRSASGLGRPPHPPDAGHPALAEYRLRGLASPRRRGGASGRPRCARPRVRPRPARRLAATSLRSCARLLRNLRGFPPKASLSPAHSSALEALPSVFPTAQA